MITLLNKPSKPIITSISNGIFCEGDSISFSTTTGYQYLWSNGNTLQQITIKNSLALYLKAFDSYCWSDYSDTIQTRMLSSPVKRRIIANGFTLTSDIRSANYQWSLDGVIISGANQISHTAIVDGDYLLEISPLNGCSKTSDKFYLLGTSVSKINSPFDVKISPSPITEHLNISAKQEIVKVEIINTSGKVVLQIMPNAKFISFKPQVLPGLYILIQIK
ncbi:MAG: hypothetical protein ACI9GM_000670 [Salibacteraceae bacterium]